MPEHHLQYSLRVIIALVLVTGSLVAQDETSTPLATNLELLQKLSRAVGDSVAAYLHQNDSVHVIVRSSESAWYVEGVILQAFDQSGRVPVQLAAAPYEVEFGLTGIKTEYANVRRSGLFGAKLLDRMVRVEFLTKIVDRRQGVVLLNRTFVQSASDVIEASDVERLENPIIPATRGVLPTEGFFSTILEPLAALGAVAVAVYLLFHVRS
jgi:hypothetical protein